MNQKLDDSPGNYCTTSTGDFIFNRNFLKYRKKNTYSVELGIFRKYPFLHRAPDADVRDFTLQQKTLNFKVWLKIEMFIFCFSLMLCHVCNANKDKLSHDSLIRWLNDSHCARVNYKSQIRQNIACSR